MTVLRLSGGEVYVEEVGSGRPLLVLHGGLGLDHSYLRPAFDRFAGRYRVVYMDFLGNGRSDRTIDYDAIVDNSIWVRQVGDLIDALGLRDPVLIGHSYGGYVSLEFAATQRGRGVPLVLVSTAASLKHLDLVDANAVKRGTPEQVRAVREGLAVPQASDEAWKALWRTLLPLYFHAPTEAMVEAAAAPVAYCARGFNTAHLKVVPGYDMSGRLGEIAARTLVICGDDDWILPLEPCSLALARGIAGASLAVLPDCGHFPFSERPEAFRSVTMDWLGRLGA